MREQNPNCKRVQVTFRISGKTLDPHEITRATGITPDLWCRKGELPRNSAGQVTRKSSPPAKKGRWHLNSEESSGSTALDDHLESILMRIDPQLSHFIDVVATHEADFFIGWWAAPTSVGGGPSVSPPILKKVARLGAAIEFDFYGPEWNE